MFLLLRAHVCGLRTMGLRQERKGTPAPKPTRHAPAWLQCRQQEGLLMCGGAHWEAVAGDGSQPSGPRSRGRGGVCACECRGVTRPLNACALSPYTTMMYLTCHSPHMWAPSCLRVRGGDTEVCRGQASQLVRVSLGFYFASSPTSWDESRGSLLGTEANEQGQGGEGTSLFAY